MNVLGFDELKDMYKYYPNFKEAYAACENPISIDRTPSLYCMIHEGFLFKGRQLCAHTRTAILNKTKSNKKE